MTDYSLEFPEKNELLEEPKHFGRLTMWRKLRQISGTLINVIERLENWTEYLFGSNGKINLTTYEYPSPEDLNLEIKNANIDVFFDIPIKAPNNSNFNPIICFPILIGAGIMDITIKNAYIYLNTSGIWNFTCTAKAPQTGSYRISYHVLALGYAK